MGHSSPMKSAFDASARIFSACVTTHLRRRIFPNVKNRIDSQTSKFGSSVIAGGYSNGAGPTALENFHVVDGEGRAGRRTAELRLVECFGARQFQQRTMVEGWGMLPVQRGRGSRRQCA